MFVSVWVKTHILTNAHTRTLGLRAAARLVYQSEHIVILFFKIFLALSCTYQPVFAR